MSGLADAGNAAGGRETLELLRVVAGDDAVGRAGERNHALLRADVGGFVRRIEGGAGAVGAQIFVKVAIVGGEDVGRIAGDANVLRGESVARSGEGADAREDFDVVAFHQAQLSLRVATHEFEDVVGIYAAVMSAG